MDGDRNVIADVPSAAISHRYSGGIRESRISSAFLTRFATFGIEVCQFALLVHSRHRIPRHVQRRVPGR
jgi:hypothetical protein